MTNAAHDPLVGTVFDGRYTVLARLGEGGMGVVYKAQQHSINRVVALKTLHTQLAQDPTWVQRFYNEAKACSRLQHPNTIRMFDFGQTGDGRLFMTMEYLDGQTLRDALRTGPMPAERVLRILMQCCASLAEAHAMGIIHRDIKPDNVFLLALAGSPDYVKLLDFSVAKLLQDAGSTTQAGVVFGTPQYMSPEQGYGQPLDARSDVYAIGILAYEMLVGRVPFHDENPMTVIQMHLRATLPPLPAHIPAPLQAIVVRALDKDARRRFQSAGEFAAQCQAAYAQLSGTGTTADAAPTVRGTNGPNALASYVAASPMQRTLIGEMPPQAISPRPNSPSQPGQIMTTGPAKTVLLQASEGIVSVAQQGIYLKPAGPTTAGGATLTFWLVCLGAGVLIGALAFFVMRQL